MRGIFPLALLVLIIALLPLLEPWTEVVLTLALAKGFAVLGIIVLLQAGQVSFGHAMFMAASAYCVAFLANRSGVLEISLLLPAALLCSALMGLLVGLFVVRYRYIFFGMLNLAFSMVLYSVLEKFFYITGGSDGMRVPRPLLLGQELERADYERWLFYLTLTLAVLLSWLVWRYLRSPLGQALAALKTNETRLEYLGVSARRVLLIAYIISALLAGLGGTLLALAQGLVTPEYGYWVRSGELVFIAILGGAGHVAGAFIGALVYEVVRLYAAAYAADIWQLILGSFLLLIILFAPQGLVGMAQHWLRRRGSPP
ncbi:MAG: branched-chain amino acid ABC transporter permease [Gammaproteobacteria bacterium]